MSLVLLIILILLFAGGLPNIGPISHQWGYGPSSFVGLLVLILIVLMLMGRL